MNNCFLSWRIRSSTRHRYALAIFEHGAIDNLSHLFESVRLALVVSGSFFCPYRRIRTPDGQPVP